MAKNFMQIHDSAYPIHIQTTMNIPQLSHVNHADYGDGDDEYFSSIPLGYRFRPTDVELINEYLLKKINHQRLPRSRIHEVKLYDFDPQFLAENFKASGENEWYFFTPREKKYKNGSIPNRAAGDGFWKATVADKIIIHDGEKIGYRKRLSYHRGEPTAGDKTCWLMTEFRIANPPTPIQMTRQNDMMLDDWVLCRVYINPKALSDGDQIEKPTEGFVRRKHESRKK